MKRFTGTIVALALIIQLTGCGTLFYPERIGQKGGDIDIKVALLDGIGLLFFVVPGVVAFFVDISNGTIYLPNSRYGAGNSEKKTRIVKADEPITQEYLQRVIRKEYGAEIDLNAPDTRIQQVDTIDVSRVSQLGSAG